MAYTVNQGDMAYTKLTSEQLNILNFATSGHNFCIFGKASVGKTTSIREIKSELEKKRKEMPDYLFKRNCMRRVRWLSQNRSLSLWLTNSRIATESVTKAFPRAG